MNTEFEITFTGINRDEIRNKIQSIGGICTKENTLMKRSVFESPSNARGSYLRVRDEGDKVTCTYKEENLNSKDIHSMRELETVVGNYSVMVQIFEKLGLRKKSYQETYREVWMIADEVEIMIDEWPGLKPYIEIEAQSEEHVRKYTKLLGFDYDDGIFGSSFDIYEQELGLDYSYINSLEEISFSKIPGNTY